MTNMVETIMGVAGVTFRVAADDTSNALIADGGLTIKSGNRVVQAVLITCETYAVRIALAADAVQTGGSEVGHTLAVGSSLFISNAANVRSLRYINETNGENGRLQITPFYATT